MPEEVITRKKNATVHGMCLRVCGSNDIAFRERTVNVRYKPRRSDSRPSYSLLHSQISKLFLPAELDTTRSQLSTRWPYLGQQLSVLENRHRASGYFWLGHQQAFS